MVKLFIDDLRLSPYTYSVQSALLEKKIDFDLRPISFKKGKTPDQEFIKLSPTELIPLFVDGNLVLSESMAILEYIEEKFKSPQYPSLFPKSIEARAQARMLMSWYRCGFTALRNERSAETIFYESERAKSPLSHAAQEEVRDWAKALKGHLKSGQKFLFGEWSIADQETAFMLHRLMMNGDPLDSTLAEYANGIWNRPSAQEFALFRRPPYQSYYS